MNIQYIFALFCLTVVNGQTKTRKPCPGQEHISYYDPFEIKEHCWFEEKDIKNICANLEAIEAKYQAARDSIQGSDYSYKLKHRMVSDRGVDSGEYFSFGGTSDRIPAGLNVGGYTLYKDVDALLVFYRMKLRNNTHFTMKKITHDFQNLILYVDLYLNDMFFVGEYDRSLLGGESTLNYRPNHGYVKLNLKSVTFVAEARMRLINEDTFQIEHIISDLDAQNYDLYFDNLPYEPCPKDEPIKIYKTHLFPFMNSLQRQLDSWLKDYLNGYVKRVANKLNKSPGMRQFDKEKQLYLIDQVDAAIAVFKKRIAEMNFIPIRIPSFKILILSKQRFNLLEGRVIGMDGMYRRSIATSSGPGGARFVAVDVGFHVKVVYKYRMILGDTMRWINGELQFTSDNVKAQMHLGYLRDDGFIEMYLTSIELSKIENLILEGQAAQYIASFKHIFEHEVMALTSYGMLHTIASLNTLVYCRPMIAFVDKDQKGEVMDYDDY